MKSKKNRISLYLCLTLIIIFVIAFTFIAFNIKGDFLKNIDNNVYNFALSIRSDFLTVFFVIITNFVNPIVLAIISIIILLFFSRQRKYIFALFLNLGLSAILFSLLKITFVRARPDSALMLVEESGYSFPSGHTMMAVCFFGFLIYLIWQSTVLKRTKIFMTILNVLLILLISFSRIYLCVHYLTDIVGAICASLIYFIIFILIVHRLFTFEQIEPTEYKKHSFIQGFKYAFNGIITAFKCENNLLIQFSATMLVVLFGVFLNISGIEWCICLIMCALVISLELVNTCIENICDKITLENDSKIGMIKDISAGAVLMMSLFSIIIALVIFIPKLLILF